MCLEKLFGKYPKALQPGFFGGRKRPIGAPSTPFDRFRNHDPGSNPIFQTVSKGDFSEVRTRLCSVASWVWRKGISRVERRAGERRHAVYARVSSFEGPPELMNEALRQAREEVLPEARQMEGFKGMIALGDRQSGKALGITFWESEEAMRASEEAANRLREESAEAGGERIAGVDRYEVEFFEMEG